MSAEPISPPVVIDTSLGPIEHASGITMAEVLDVLRTLTNGVGLWHRLRRANLAAGLTWVVPLHFPEITRLYGMPVRRADVPAPMLAHDVIPFP